MGYIKSGNTIYLTASLTYKGRKNLLFSINDIDSQVASFTLSDNDVNYVIAENVSNITDYFNIPENGFLPDFTGDEESCIKAITLGINENFPKSYILQNKLPQVITYIWDVATFTCLTTNTFPNTVIYGQHNTGNALYQNLTRLINGVVDQSYLINVPTNIVGDSLKTWLSNRNNVKATIDDNTLNSLVNSRIINTNHCLLDVDFNLTTDQVDVYSPNDSFIVVGNVIGGNGIYKVSLDNGLTYNDLIGATYKYSNLPENQTRSIIVKDTQNTPFSSKKSITTPMAQTIPYKNYKIIESFNSEQVNDGDGHLFLRNQTTINIKNAADNTPASINIPIDFVELTTDITSESYKFKTIQSNNQNNILIGDGQQSNRDRVSYFVITPNNITLPSTPKTKTYKLKVIPSDQRDSDTGINYPLIEDIQILVYDNNNNLVSPINLVINYMVIDNNGETFTKTLKTFTTKPFSYIVNGNIQNLPDGNLHTNAEGNHRITTIVIPGDDYILI